MSINQQWKQAVEEFGDRAFERFDTVGNFVVSNLSIECALDQGFDVQLKELNELFEHDVLIYGDDAYLMWRKLVFLGDATDFYELKSNDDIDFNNINFDMHRKTSLALPFDLSRAKAGDAVQYFDENENKFIDVIKIIEYRESDKQFTINVIAPNINFYGVKSSDLRMKYPKKLDTNR